MENIIIGTSSTNSIHSGNTVSIDIDSDNNFKKLTPTKETYSKYREQIEDLNTIKDDLLRLKAYLLIKEQMEYDFIKKYYETCLKNLYLHGLMCELHNRFGDNIILTSNEETSEFSHRRVFADYCELENGIYIPEIYTDQNKHVKRINPIRYKKALYRAMKDSN